MTEQDDIEIVHHPVPGRFLAEIDGLQAHLDYEIEDDVMRITHTRVPADLEGRGIGGRLVRAAVEHARHEGLKVQAACSFAAAWIQRHPQFHELRAGA
jgi:uncharacterized protein